jgi:hypothetical protein
MWKLNTQNAINYPRKQPGINHDRFVTATREMVKQFSGLAVKESADNPSVLG